MSFEDTQGNMQPGGVMRSKRFLAVCAFVSLVACSAPSNSGEAKSTAAKVPASSEEAWSAPALDHAISVRDGKTGERISLPALLDVLTKADAVFLGESHTDETTHRVELAVYDGLLARRPDHVVLAMEMFERDAQPALDAYLKGEIDEPAFLTRARPWSTYRTAYRPLIERAKAAHAPVVASNFPAPLMRRVSRDGAGMTGVKPEEMAFVPVSLFPNTPAYWKRVDNATRGHRAMMGPPPAPDDPRLTATQSLWDNTMGESCALALDRHPGSAVLHVNGGFHSEYWDGTARQLRLRKPGAVVRTVAIVPTANPSVAELGGKPVADYVVFAEERAQDENDGKYAVDVPRRLEYRLHVPHTASDSARVPLLVWLADDGEDAESALSAWVDRIGDTCAIAVVEAPYRERQDDLVEGGRWYWSDSFREDIGALREGIERVWSFVLRRQPIDPARVVFAGEGTGATVVASTTLLSDELAVRAIGFGPRRYADIKDFPLPLPEERGDAPPVKKSLALWVAESDRAWWTGELAEYTAIGFENSLATFGTDAWRAEIDRENTVRTALGLPARDLPADAPRAHVVVDAPRAREWARRIAFERSKQGELVALLDAAPKDTKSTSIELAVHAADYASGAALPRAPGPFGGTTIVVLPADLPATEVAAWKELEKNDPIAKSSRFHALVVATQTGERTLPVVLAELAKKKKKNMLIVPAVWCAEGDTMRALRRSARDFEDQMNLSWRPGLGGLR
jgi:uncharacterized iron-regulated protein/predicted esterase